MLTDMARLAVSLQQPQQQPASGASDNQGQGADRLRTGAFGMGPDPLMSLSMSQSASGVNVASDTAYPSHIGFDEPRAEPVLYASGISSSGPVGEGNSTASILLLHPTSGPGFDNTGAAPLDDHLDRFVHAQVPLATCCCCN